MPTAEEIAATAAAGQVTTPTAEEQAAQAAAATAADKAAKAADAERIARMESSVKALEDIVKTSLAGRQAANTSSDGKPGAVTPQMRQMLRQQGLTDADIDLNAPLIQPFLAATLAAVGPEILGNIQTVRDEVDMVKASRNVKKYPWFGVLEEEIHGIREAASKTGTYLSPAQAYEAAVAADVAATESKIEAAKAAKKADVSAGADASAQELRHHGTRAGGTGQRRTALTAEDIAALPRAERKKLFEQLGDQPIR